MQFCGQLFKKEAVNTPYNGNYTVAAQKSSPTSHDGIFIGKKAELTLILCRSDFSPSASSQQTCSYKDEG
ncbi:hypothetical protein AX660_21950 [Paraglaciecola hydrolytica]|uniref:Uncharacterized protein n=1 Tax=Paraglaciecola hydrolytica TaxID=1799789 RepID=A0A148KM49_9ALTE|nr:hypothetical protein AX660_21950 [Paraglaciecola hydrolytica]